MLRRKFQRVSATEGVVRRLLIGCLLLGFASLLGAGAAAGWLTLRDQSHIGWVNHTYQVAVAVERAHALVEEAASTRRGYLISGRAVFLSSYRRASAEIVPAVDRIAALTIDNARQQRRIVVLRNELGLLGRRRERSNALVGQRRFADARAGFVEDAAEPAMRRIRATLTAMAREEQQLLVQRDATQRDSVRLFFVALAVAGLLLVIVAVTALAAMLRYMRDLDRSNASLAALNEGLEDQVKERTAGLTRANEEIQRFAYIVSHDLRSPLVNVMGFTAELDTSAKVLEGLIARIEAHSPGFVTRDEKMATEEDLPEAIGFIRSSTAKMDRLIGAILKLSREGRRVLAPERIDMRALTQGIRDSMIQQIAADGTELTISETLPPVVSDRLAVEQILSNLVENAAKYRQPGRPGRIEVRGRDYGNRVEYEVVDNGRGIDPNDHQRIFDLFRRAGKQDQPGEGIGLAHVRALAYRLGGTIDLASATGDGAIFRLSLPAKFNESMDA